MLQDVPSATAIVLAGNEVRGVLPRRGHDDRIDGEVMVGFAAFGALWGACGAAVVRLPIEKTDARSRIGPHETA